jgi:hypothetical protein
LIDLATARRLALTQLPLYRQIYSADFSLLDSYRLAKILLQSGKDPSRKIKRIQKRARHPRRSKTIVAVGS